MKKYFEYNGIYFADGTPIEVCDVLINARRNNTRITFDFGDTKTNKSWGEVYDISGYVGKSTGTMPILILLHNSRSIGGGAILTDCILSIKESKGKKILYANLSN